MTTVAEWPDRRGFALGARVRHNSYHWTGIVIDTPEDRPAIEEAQTYVRRDDNDEVAVVPARALELRRD